jgi:mono/diheme cytochrome c family protein
MRNLIITIISFILTLASPLAAHEWMAPKDAANARNPVPQTEGSTQRGKELFSQNCAYCHGEQAEGMFASSAVLKKDSPNLVQRLKSHTDGDYFWKIQHGRGQMPAFKDDLKNDEIWDIINFIKSIQR